MIADFYHTIEIYLSKAVDKADVISYVLFTQA